MVLIVDSNEYRRNKTSRYLRYDLIPSMSIGYEDFMYYTKPLITVLIDPSNEFVSNLKLNKETLYIAIYKNDRSRDNNKSLYTLVNTNGTVSTKEVTEIVYRHFGFDMKNDMIDHIAIFDDINQIAHNGKRVKLCKREYRVLKFFFYSQNKTFTLHEIENYLGFDGKIKDETLISYIMKINTKCKLVNRCKLIHKHKSGYEMAIYGDICPDLHNPLKNILSVQDE